MELVAPGLTNLIAWLAIVTGVVFTVWWAIGLFSIHTREREEQTPGVEAPAGIHEKLAPVPAVITIFVILTAVALVSYIFSVWLAGVTY